MERLSLSGARAPRCGMGVAGRLALLALLWLGAVQGAWAACTSPQTAHIASGGTAVFTCADAGFTNIVTPPQHGTVDPNSGYGGNVFAMPYVNNGDGATSDTFVVGDDAGVPVQFQITIDPPVGQPLAITTTTLPAPVYNTAYSQTIQASGGNGVYTFSIGGGAPPPGLTLSSAGSLAGTPTVPGNYSFTVHLVDTASHATDRTYSFTLAAPTVAITPAALGGGTYHQAYQQTTAFSASGGAAPYTFSAVNPAQLPPGVTLSGNQLTGTPTGTGTFNFTVQAQDANGQTGTRSYSVTIASAAPTAPTGVAAVADTGAAGTQGSASVTFTPSTDNGGSAPLSYMVTSVPDNGAPAVGTASPIAIGNLTRGTAYRFVVTATNGSGLTAASAPSAPVTPRTADTVTIQDPGPLSVGGSATLVATTLSSTAVTFASSTPSACTITTGGQLTLLQAQPCNVSATSAGNASYAPGVGTRTLTVDAVVPAAPTIGPATTSVAAESATTGTASVSFTAPASDGGSPISSYTVKASPGGLTASGPASPVVITGLTFGTPYTFTVTATNGQGPGPASSASNSVTPTKAQSITFTNPGTQNFGTSPTLVATTSSGLPVTLASQTTGVCDIVGSAQLKTNAPGTCTIQATQLGNGAIEAASAVTQSFLIAVPGGAVTITTASLPNATYGVAYSQTVSASGGAQPYHFAQTGTLPPGLAFTNGTNSGTLSGTPTAAGTFNFSVTVTDQATQTATQNYTVTVAAVVPGAPAIGGVTAPDAAVGATTGSATVPFTPPANTGGSAITGYVVTSTPGHLTASGSASPITVPGLTLGTPYTFTVRATNGIGDSPESTDSGAVTPVGQQAITYVDTAPRDFGTTTALQATATSGLPVAFASQTTNVCSVTSGNQVQAKAPGTCTIQATQGGSPAYRAATAVTQSFQVVVPGGAVTITTPALPAPTRGVAYSQTIAASGGAPRYTFTVIAGALPSALSLSPSGTVSGVVNTTGTFGFTVQVTDQAGQTATQNYTLTVIVPTFTFTPASLPSGQVAKAYASTTVQASGGIPNYTYVVTAGALPTGLSLSPAGVVAGTPTAAGSYPVTITATDAYGVTGTQGYTVVIAQPVPVAVDDTAAVGANASVTVPVTTNDQGPIASLAISQAPGHGSATVNGLNIVYTPAHDYFGTDTLKYTATGPGGTSNAATVTVSVAAGPVPTVIAHKVTVLAGKPVTVHAAEGAANGPFTAATVVSAPASGTVQVQGTDLVYTPSDDASGDIAFTYTLSNAFGASQPAQVTVTVNPVPVAPPVSATAVSGRNVRVNVSSAARGGPFTGANVLSVAPANAGAASIESSADGYVLVFNAAATYGGTVQIAYTLSNAYATSAPGYVTVTVTARPDPSKDAEVLGVLSAQADATRRMAVGQISNFQRRLETLHSGGPSGFTNGITLASAGSTRGKDAYASLRTAQDEASRRYLVQPNADSAEGTANASSQHGTLPGDVSVWTGGAVNFGKSQVGTSDNGTDFTTSGVSVGVDKQFNDKFAAGVGLGYGHDDSDVGNNGSHSAVDTYNVALYGSFRPAPSFYIDALAGYQWLSFDSKRYVTADGNRVSGSRDGRQWFASLSTGYNHVGEQTQLTPYARLDMARARLDGFTEHGDDLYALDYRSQTVKTTTATVGVLAQWSVKRDYGIWAPQLRAEFGHDMQGSSQASLRYADTVEGPLYRATLYQQSRNHSQLGAGVALQTNGGWMLRAEYQLQLDNTSRDNQSILLGIEKKFGP